MLFLGQRHSGWPPSKSDETTMKTTIRIIGFLAAAIIACYVFLPDDLTTFIHQTHFSSSDDFQTDEIETWFNLDIKRDVLVFLHIQKTGGKMLDSILVHSLNLETPCYCVRHIPPGCRCRSANGHIWLYSRLSTNWACGVHADWTELHECVPRTLNFMERKFKAIPSNRSYRYITILRDPVSRYLSEWLHMRRGADWTILHKCRGSRASPQDFPPCHKGLTWINVTLKDFMECPTNPARNRQTYMLADMREVNCYNLTGMEDRVRQKRILLSAKRNLRSMPFFALTDFMNESLFLVKTMGVSFKTQIGKHPGPKASLLRLDQNIIKKIKELNKLDIELYDHAKKLFFVRLHAAQKRTL